MVRSVVADDSVLPYLINLATPQGYSIGLILGQTSTQRDFVIHLALTPRPVIKDFTEESADASSALSARSTKAVVIKSIQDIEESWIAGHAKHVTRMLPGGMWVLGIFIVGPGDLFADTHAIARIRSVLLQIKKTLSSNRYLHGDSPTSQKLVLHVCSTSHRLVCKMVDTNLSSSVIPVEWKFLPQPCRWHQLDSLYDIDQMFPIVEDLAAASFKKHAQSVLASLSQQIEKAVGMIDGEVRDESEALDSFIKKKKGKANSKSTGESKAMSVNLYIPCIMDAPKESEFCEIQCCGELVMIGNLASRVFVHQKATVEEAITAAKQDIIRSLASRLEMHWDSLIEEEQGSPEEKLTVHGPPRRVLVPLPRSRVALSGFLFPGEGLGEALVSFQELLGLDVKEEEVDEDFETNGDPAELFAESRMELDVDREHSSDELMPSMSTNMWLAGGLGVSIAVLAILLAVQFSWG